MEEGEGVCGAVKMIPEIDKLIEEEICDWFLTHISKRDVYKDVKILEKESKEPST